MLSMNRRTVLASVGAAVSLSGAGCLLARDDSGPTFSLRDVRLYRPDDRTAIVTGRVEKRGSDAGNVIVRAELRIENTYDHADTQEFVISEDVDDRRIAAPFEYDSAVFEGRAVTARAKIVRHGEADSDWVTADG